MRTGEVFALTWDDIDFKNRVINVRHSVYDKPKNENGRWYLGTTKTKNGVRQISISNTLLRALANYRSKQQSLKALYGNEYHSYRLEEIKNKYGKVQEYPFCLHYAPMPQYVVFYNGNENYPDQQILKLSDAFERSEDKMDIHPALECEAKVLNVNYGHNADIMNKCTRLMHYSIFIETVNRNIAEGYSIQQAISNAIDECIGKGILTDILIQNRAEVCHMLLTEFDTKKYGKNMWQEGYSEGHDTGYSEGHDTGYSTGLSEGCDVTLEIIMKINEGNNTEEKLVSLGYDPELVRKILNNYK